MALTGNLDTFPLSSILQLVSDDKKTGVLRVNGNHARVQIVIRNGVIIYATSSRKEVRLGNLLIKNRMVSPDHLKKCIEHARQNNQSIGVTLIERGYITLPELKNMIHQQVKLILLDLCIKAEGNFEYHDARINLNGMVVTEIDSIELALEASRIIDEMTVFKENIPSDEMIFRHRDSAVDRSDLKLTTEQWQIFSFVNAERTVLQIIEDSGQDTFQVYQTLAGFLDQRLIEAIQGEKRLPAPVVSSVADYSLIITIYTDILRLIYKQLEREIGKQAASLFSNSRQTSVALQEKLLQQFNTENPSSTNVHNISKAMARFSSFEEGARFLIETFADYIYRILSNAMDLLGIGPLKQVFGDIEKIIPYFNQYQISDSNKSHIIVSLREMIGRVESAVADKQDSAAKSGGFFSMFR